MGGVSSLPRGMPRPPAHPAGGRAAVAAWSRTTLRILRELEAANVVALDGAAVACAADRSILPLVAKTLTELALLVRAVARSGAELGEVAPPKAARDVFRRKGDYWTISWRGESRLVRDVRGLHYVAHLLRHPGREFHALDLVDPNGSGALRSDGIPALDSEAKATYRRRLDDLRDDLAEAERIGDVGRAARARAEREALAEQLAAAMGLGGRDRLAGAAAERARCAVTQCIRVALKRIRTALPALADDLRLHIKTGVYCVYVPDAGHRPTGCCDALRGRRRRNEASVRGDGGTARMAGAARTSVASHRPRKFDRSGVVSRQLTIPK